MNKLIECLIVLMKASLGKGGGKILTGGQTSATGKKVILIYAIGLDDTGNELGTVVGNIDGATGTVLKAGMSIAGEFTSVEVAAAAKNKFLVYYE